VDVRGDGGLPSRSEPHQEQSAEGNFPAVVPHPDSCRLRRWWMRQAQQGHGIEAAPAGSSARRNPPHPSTEALNLRGVIGCRHPEPESSSSSWRTQVRLSGARRAALLELLDHGRRPGVVGRTAMPHPISVGGLVKTRRMSIPATGFEAGRLARFSPRSRGEHFLEGCRIGLGLPSGGQRVGWRRQRRL